MEKKDKEGKKNNTFFRFFHWKLITKVFSSIALLLGYINHFLILPLYIYKCLNQWSKAYMYNTLSVKIVKIILKEKK